MWSEEANSRFFRPSSELWIKAIKHSDEELQIVCTNPQGETMQAIAHFANQIGLKSVATFIGSVSEILSEEQVRLSCLPTPPPKPEQPPIQTTSAENRESIVGLYELLEGSNDTKPVTGSDMTGLIQLAESLGLLITKSPLGGFVLNTETYFDECWGNNRQHLLGGYTRIKLDEANSSLDGSLRTLVIIGQLMESIKPHADDIPDYEYFKVTETVYENQTLITFSWKCFPQMPWCELRKLVSSQRQVKTVENIAHQSTVFDSSPPVKSTSQEANPEDVFKFFQQRVSQQRRA